MDLVAPIGKFDAMTAAPVELMRTQLVPQATGTRFSDILTNGLNEVDTKIAKADALVEAFAKGESVPVHQVAMALEEARISVEMAVQVRTRLLESYRDFMSMQL